MSVMTYMPYGADGIIIRVETDIRRGIPGVDISGLADGAVREARERVRAAFRNSGFHFPQDRILINLAPAGFKKDGAAFDLPIALSVMEAAGIIPLSGNILVMGELELSGMVRPVRGVLAAIAAGLTEGINEFIVPAENAEEAAILAAKDMYGSELSSYKFKKKSVNGGIKFAAVETLQAAANALLVREEKGELPVTLIATKNISPIIKKNADFQEDENSSGNPTSNLGNDSNGDFADVYGQPVYKRALEIAVAGGHNVLVFGPPGAGKTMLARKMPSIMASLTPDEAVEVTRLYSLAGSLSGTGGLITRPPFRSPHHSASAEGILGGGRIPRPGEITLSHFGVLFLDEAPEFKINVLQALREPLEDRVISISRAEGPVRLPAEFQLVMATNPCPCGRLGIRDSETHLCFCSPEEINRYWRRFGGALLDRVEIRAAVLPPKIEEMELTSQKINTEEKSEKIAQRVKKAVEIQRHRFGGTGIRRNALIPSGKISQFCQMNKNAENAIQIALSKLGLSGRAFHGILRVARTIADLEEKEIIESEQILEAIHHRRLGEDPWEILSM